MTMSADVFVVSIHSVCGMNRAGACDISLLCQVMPQKHMNRCATSEPVVTTRRKLKGKTHLSSDHNNSGRRNHACFCGVREGHDWWEDSYIVGSISIVGIPGSYACNDHKWKRGDIKPSQKTQNSSRFPIITLKWMLCLLTEGSWYIHNGYRHRDIIWYPNTKIT
jgi:hypothetical protein